MKYSILSVLTLISSIVWIFKAETETHVIIAAFAAAVSYLALTVSSIRLIKRSKEQFKQ